MSQQTPTQIICSDCGKAATVPFKPVASKPVYCRECLAKHSNRPTTKPFTQARGHSEESEKQAWSRRRENWK